MKSIKNKLLAFAILATLVPSIGLGLLSFWRYQNLIGDNVTLELRTLADHAGSELALWQRERVNELRALATANAVVDGLSPAAAPRGGAVRIGPRELEVYLRGVRKRLDTLVELTVADASGQVVASSAATPAPVRLPATWSNTAVTEGFIVEPPHRDPARATATLTVLVPILSARNELLGVLSAVLDLGHVLPRLQHIAAASPAELFLLAPDGVPLLGTRGAPTELPGLEPQVLEQLRQHPDAPTAYTGHHGQAVIGLVGRPGPLPVLVVAERDRAGVYAAWLDSLQLFLGLVAGLTLLVGMVAWWMGHSIVRPLDRLMGAADRIAGGDLGVQLQVADDGEIGHLTRVFNKMVDRLRRSHGEVRAANRVLQEQNRLLETLSVTDSLTGVFNRKKLDDILADQFARFRRSHRPFALLMLDIDNFKRLNDTHGHLAGDAVLARLAAILRRSVRSVDYVARYGGEEFVVVLVETPAAVAVPIAERIRAQVELPLADAAGAPIAFTVSLGVSDSRIEDAGPEDALARADRAMYEAKDAGRNNVRSA